MRKQAMLYLAGNLDQKDSKPRPRVLLDCEAPRSCGVWISHLFVELRASTQGVDVVYKCAICDHEKVFGRR